MNRWIDLKPFKTWCIQILPSIFDESMSYYEILCKVIKILNNSLEDINILKEEIENTNSAFDRFKEEVNSQIENTNSAFDGFKEEVRNQIAEGIENTNSAINRFKEEVNNQFEELVNGTWIQGTIPYLEELLKQYIPVAIFFEINDEGYFVANIPETWDEIQFNTSGYDYPEINGVGYGHLVISY